MSPTQFKMKNFNSGCQYSHFFFFYIGLNFALHRQHTKTQSCWVVEGEKWACSALLRHQQLRAHSVQGSHSIVKGLNQHTLFLFSLLLTHRVLNDCEQISKWAPVFNSLYERETNLSPERQRSCRTASRWWTPNHLDGDLNGSVCVWVGVGGIFLKPKNAFKHTPIANIDVTEWGVALHQLLTTDWIR